MSIINKEDYFRLFGYKLPNNYCFTLYDNHVLIRLEHEAPTSTEEELETFHHFINNKIFFNIKKTTHVVVTTFYVGNEIHFCSSKLCTNVLSTLNNTFPGIILFKSNLCDYVNEHGSWFPEDVYK